MPYVFDTPRVASLPVVGSNAVFPIHRVYCIGRNYADHAKEMGATPGVVQPDWNGSSDGFVCKLGYLP